MCYPLAEEGITEDFILKWARTQSIFDGWYDVFRRQGCWLCPNTSMLQLAWLYKTDKDKFELFLKLIAEYEEKYAPKYFHVPAEELRNRIMNKWVPILEERMNPAQVQLF